MNPISRLLRVSNHSLKRRWYKSFLFTPRQISKRLHQPRLRTTTAGLSCGTRPGVMVQEGHQIFRNIPRIIRSISTKQSHVAISNVRCGPTNFSSSPDKRTCSRFPSLLVEELHQTHTEGAQTTSPASSPGVKCQELKLLVSSIRHRFVISSKSPSGVHMSSKLLPTGKLSWIRPEPLLGGSQAHNTAQGQNARLARFAGMLVRSIMPKQARESTIARPCETCAPPSDPGDQGKSGRSLGFLKQQCAQGSLRPTAERERTTAEHAPSLPAPLKDGTGVNIILLLRMFRVERRRRCRVRLTTAPEH